MNAGIRTRKRRAWPGGLEQTSSGRYRWQPPAKVLPLISATIPPTFHETRSLSMRLYAEQGVNVQALSGHKDPAMTAIYTDSRGSEWLRVS